MFNFMKWFYKKPAKSATAPITLEEVVEYFNLPPKEKTAADIIRDYQVKETMTHLELGYLKDDPSLYYRGGQSWHDKDGNKYFDFVPCVLRPEVLYCAYGKN